MPELAEQPLLLWKSESDSYPKFIRQNLLRERKSPLFWQYGKFRHEARVVPNDPKC